MNVAIPLKCGANGIDLQLAVEALNRNQFRATREKFRGAAFISLTMRELMTNDGVVGTAKLSQGECVRRCSVENQEVLSVSFKDFTDPSGQAASPFVISVGNIRFDVGGGQRS